MIGCVRAVALAAACGCIVGGASAAEIGTSPLLQTVRGLRPSLVVVRSTAPKPAADREAARARWGLVLGEGNRIVTPIREGMAVDGLEVVRDGRPPIPAMVKFVDRDRGVLVLEVPTPSAGGAAPAAAKTKESKLVEAGDSVIMVQAFDLFEANPDPRISVGIVSSLRSDGPLAERRIQVDWSSCTGVVGGLVFDEEGRFIGVGSGGRGSQGILQAVPVEAIPFLDPASPKWEGK